MSRTLLVDGDVLAYTSAIYNEVAMEEPPGYWFWYCEFSKVIDSIEWQLNEFKKTLEAKDIILCLTDNNHNFRKDVLSTYKGNRSNLKKPLVLKPTREYLINTLGAKIIPGLEGDDLMGIWQTEDTVIVSIDKDMKTIPGKYFNPNAGIIVDISEEEANWWHMYQTLVGDTIDGYSGLQGYGAVTAKKLLDRDSSWSSVVKAYQSKGLTEGDALVQARCARILRSEDYNQETGEIKLWTPTSMEVSQ